MVNSLRPMLLIIRICIFSLQWIFTHQQVNVALGGVAEQSSTYGSFQANFAIDGNRLSNIAGYSCSSTNFDYSPWWRVDLLKVYYISIVSITNRGDCCSNRINGAEIHIGNSLVNSNNDPRCTVIPTIPAGQTVNYTCNMEGRYVNLVIPNIYQYLTLCEVEVYAVPANLIKKIFLKVRFSSSEDLSNPTTRVRILDEIKSITNSSIYQVKWIKEPVLET